MTNGTISEKCETLYNKLNSFVTSVINRDVTPQINNLKSGKANTVHTHTSANVFESRLLPNIEIGWGASQSVVNEAVDEKLGSLSTSITNLIQIQELFSGQKSINNGSNTTVSHTVSACPSGYNWLFVLKESFRCNVTDTVFKNSTTFQYALYNHSGGNSTACYIKGYLIYYPSTWNI